MSDAILERCREILADGPSIGFTHDGLTVVQTAILESSTGRILPVGVAVLQADEEIGRLGWILSFAELGEASNRNLGLDPWIPDRRQFWPDYERQALPAVLSRWRHHKGGEYQVVAVAFEPIGRTDPLVIYRPVGDDSIRWARPLSSWNQLVDFGPKEEPIYRFTPVVEPAPGPAETEPASPVVVPAPAEEPDAR